MVLEHRSSVAVIHRAPPLPIISTPNTARRSNGSLKGLASTPNGLSNYQFATNYGSHLDHTTLSQTTYSSSYTNGFTNKTHKNNSTSSSPNSQKQTRTTAPRPNITSSRRSRHPLTVEEYESDFRRSASDLDLIERVFRSGLSSNKLRSVLWPYVFGLTKKRGRFMRLTTNGLNGCHLSRDQENDNFVYIEHEENLKRWKELEKSYRTYENQWKSIQPDQELRFSSFRERKSLIERDVVRSDRTHPFYSSANNSRYNSSENLEKLNNVLMTYMMYDFDIGYLQGMSDLAAPILYVFQGNEIKTFWVFVEVMKLFRRNFEYSQKTIHFQLNCLFRLIKLTDAKLANYLRDIDCSNCFFVFRHIVCQFKRELMRASASSASSAPADSAGLQEDPVDDLGDQMGANERVSNGKTSLRDDYANVLNLWDTIWSVQKRHELRAKSKCVHTFKIAATGTRATPATGSNYDYKVGCCCCCKHHNSQQTSNNNNSTNHQQYHCNRNNQNNTYQHQNRIHSRGSPSNGNKDSKIDGIVSSTTMKAYPQNVEQKTSNTFLRKCSDAKLQFESEIESSISSTSSNCSSSSEDSLYSCCTKCAPKLDDNQTMATPKVKQEQIVYTKETFYSSFDPNQADVPRFDLTETEKFVISLCMSLIRRERNYILTNRLDASELHQHFIRPRLASDMDQFLGQAYEIYHYLNNECDLQTLVKGANEFASPNDFSPIGAQILARSGASGALFKNNSAISMANGLQQDQASSCATNDTYDLLKDYFIISPTAYNISMNSLNSLGLEPATDSPPPFSSGQAAHMAALRRKFPSTSGGVANGSPSSYNATTRGSWEGHLMNSTPPSSTMASSARYE